MNLIGNQDVMPDFQWPTLAEMKKFPINKRIKLNKIVFKQKPSLKGIQLKFTNGIESPLFETSTGSKLPEQETSIDISSRIARVGVYVSHFHKTRRPILGF